MGQENRRVGVGFGVLILRDGKILLGKRHTDHTKADSELHGEGTWTMPGGKLEFGESFEGGVTREVAEETGMRVREGSVRLISVANDRAADAHFVTIGFFAEAEGEPRTTEPDEITEWRWFPLHELPDPLFFCSREVLENYLAGRILYPAS